MSQKRKKISITLKSLLKICDCITLPVFHYILCSIGILNHSEKNVHKLLVGALANVAHFFTANEQTQLNRVSCFPNVHISLACKVCNYSKPFFLIFLDVYEGSGDDCKTSYIRKVLPILLSRQVEESANTHKLAPRL